ncbi:hypothetical protein PFDG_04174, partial [Plasmodium falciparum Dd2]
NQIFRFFTNKTVVQIWLYDKPDRRIEGIILERKMKKHKTPELFRFSCTILIKYYISL